MQKTIETIEMRRLGDGHVYRFVAQQVAGGVRYKRVDKDVWIQHDAALGWIVWDGDNNTLMGRPWDVALRDQGDSPPECEWVSKRGANSYVYRLVFV